MSARAVARMYAALMDDVDGVRLISPERLSQVTSVAIAGVDEITAYTTNRGLGYDIGFQGPADSPTLFGMAGSGGTAAYADTASGLVIAVAKNRVTAGDYSTFHHIGEIVARSFGPV
jgi:CubicO group peptidase (beta-lactamase class C family)